MTIETPHQSKNYFEGLQALRAFAAIIVMISHIFHEAEMVAAKLNHTIPDWMGIRLPYNMGVDIFFVLSGFLMVYTAQKLYQTKGAWSIFLKKRLIRIVPIYWFYTTAMIAVVMILPSALETAKASYSHFIQSYLFIPHERPAGGVKPLLSLGWTLNYEMFFYIIFAVLLFLKRQSLSWILGLGFAAFSCLHYFMPDSWVMMHFWSRPIILEFIGGMIIANIYLSGLRFPRYSVWIMLILSIISFFVVPYFVEINGFYINRIPNLIVGFGMVAALTLSANIDQVKIARPLKELGDASYTIYLAHPFFIGAVALIAVQFSLPLYMHIALSFITCIIGSYIAYLLVEKPIIKFFRKT